LISGILFTLFIFLYNDIIPTRYSTLSTRPNDDNFVSGIVRKVSHFVRENYTFFVHATFAIAYLIVTFVSIGVFPGRSVLEVLLLFFLFIIPRQRKKWGVVYDQTTNKPIPFAVINVSEVTNNGTKFIKQVVSDVDGRYRISLPDVKGTLRISVQADNYSQYERDLTTTGLMKEVELAIDLPLASKTGSKAQLKTILNQLDFHNNNKIFYLVYVVGFIPLFVSFALFGFTAPFFSYGQIVIYAIPIIWNTFTLYKRLSPSISTLSDELTHKPIQGAMVQIYDLSMNRVASIVTNSEGMLNFPVNEGEYYLNIYKSGYQTPSGYLNYKDYLIKVKIDNRGYLTQNISLKQSLNKGPDLNSSNLGLLNPFS
jgi:5-hydroxyisourate hydrolase-like protein (transthyretin family)